MQKEARYYEAAGDHKARCRLCPHDCLIQADGTGVCGVRKNIGGRLYSLNYGKVAAIAMDPIEKKPLYHFHPGSTILSVGTLGCNFRCDFCQNYHISKPEGLEQMLTAHGEETDPKRLVQLCRQQKDCIGVAYTYNEPSIWYEYILDTAQKVKEAGYKNVLVTNGFLAEEPLKELLTYIDALNIDVKAFTDEYYKRYCGGSLEAVKRSVEIASSSAHVEVTTLIIPGLNDSMEEMTELAEWLAALSPDIPLHLSRYFTQYKMEISTTPVETLKRLKEAAQKHLHYVYVGNVPQESRNTYCPECCSLLVNREGHARILGIREGKCSKCGRKADVVV